jgi:WD40 repeat protein/tRNA A-37 threonylcarbamoyl transferase component Bud32
MGEGKGTGSTGATEATRTADPETIGIRPGGARAHRPPPADRDAPRAVVPLLLVEPTHYELIGEQGRGGIGVVTKARDLRLDRIVALKELQKPTSAARLRFEREMRITSRLQHPGVVPVHECGQWPDGAPFYAMKMVEGRSLKELIGEKRSLPERLSLLPHVIAVADTIAYAHSTGVIHRDLKPANVIVGPFGETVVIDWGLAKHVDDSEDRDSLEAPTPSSDDSVTRVGEVVGTPAYMAPEQARGEPVDERADIFSLGAILHHLLSGAAPRPNDSSTTASLEPGVLAVEPGAPEELIAVVQKALAPRRAERYTSAAAFAQDLRRFQTGQLVSAHRYSPRDLLWRWARRFRVPLVAAAVALIIVAVVSAVSLRNVLRSQAVAEAERQEAVERRSEALDRLDDVVVAHARSLVHEDPGAALAMLKHFGGADGEWHLAAAVAAEATASGHTRALLRHGAGISDVVADADGRRLVTASWSGTAYLWSITPDGRPELASAKCAGLGRRMTAFIDHRSAWVAADDVGTQLLICDVESGAVRRVELASTPLARRFSRDGRHLAITFMDGDVELLDLANLHRAGRYTAGEPVHDLEFLQDTTTILATARGLHIVDLKDGLLERVPSERGAYIMDVTTIPGAPATWRALDSRGCLVPSAENGQKLCTGTPMVVEADDLVNPQEHSLGSLAVSPNGRHAAVCQSDGLWLVDLEMATVDSLQRKNCVWSKFTPDGAALLFSDFHGTVYMHTLASGATTPLAGHDEMASFLAFVRVGGDWSLITAGSDSTARLWKLPRRNPIAVMKAGKEALFHLGMVSPGFFAMDGREGVIRSWKVGDDEAQEIVSHGALAHGLSPQGGIFASSSFDGTVRVGTLFGPLATLGGATTPLGDVALADDGSKVAAAGTDGSVWVWEIPDGLGRRFDVHAGATTAILFLPDDRSVVSTGRDGRVVVTDTESGYSRDACALGGPIDDLALVSSCKWPSSRRCENFTSGNSRHRSGASPPPGSMWWSDPRKPSSSTWTSPRGSGPIWSATAAASPRSPSSTTTSSPPPPTTTRSASGRSATGPRSSSP